jgi:hypothetical protein
VLPRLVAAGAELEQVVFPPPAADGLERTVRLPDDVDYLRELITTTAAKLVVFDPLVAYLPARVNTWHDHSLRAALAPPAGLAEEQGTAVL